jgi:fatty acid synthase, animal type
MVNGMNNTCENDIVISGISGRFPNSRNLKEFADNLYNKVDMVDSGEQKWKNFHPEVPKRTGKLSGLDKFDATFFSINDQAADFIDPQGRVLLEQTYETLIDAGVSPQSLYGSRTGVFIGCNYNDSKDEFILKYPSKNGQTVTGYVQFSSIRLCILLSYVRHM